MKTGNEEKHVGVKSGAGAKVTTDSRLLLSDIFLPLSFLRVLRVLRGSYLNFETAEA
jgi:hypothetical protein